MRVGDEVATNDGLLGKVTDLDDYFVTIDVAQGVSIESVNVQVQRHAIAQMVPKGTFKELTGGGGKKSKGSGKKSKTSANNLSGQIVATQSDNATEDATFENPYTEDATLELKELEAAKQEIEEKIKKVSVREDVDAIVQGEDEPSLKLMDIIQDILDIEDKVIDVKIKLKKLTPQIHKPQNRKLHPSFFKDVERKSSDDDEDDTDDE